MGDPFGKVGGGGTVGSVSARFVRGTSSGWAGYTPEVVGIALANMLISVLHLSFKPIEEQERWPNFGQKTPEN